MVAKVEKRKEEKGGGIGKRACNLPGALTS